MAIKILIGLLIVCNAGLVSAMSSSNYAIPISDFNQGGGVRASGQYRIDDAIGQGKMTGDMKSSNYNLSIGLITVLLPQSGTPTTPVFLPQITTMSRSIQIHTRRMMLSLVETTSVLIM